MSKSKFSTVDGCGILVAGLLTLALLAGVVEPTRAANRRTAARMQASARERQRLATINTSIHALTLQVQRNTLALANNPVKIQPPQALNGRLVELAALAGEAGLSVTELKPSGREQGEHFVIIPLKLTGHGGYVQCTRFLHQLHDRLPEFGVSGFSLAGSPEQPAASAHFQFALFWISEAAPAAPSTPAAAVADLR